MATSYETVQNLKETGMVEDQAVGVARAIAAQSVERHELELTETRLTNLISGLSSRIEALETKIDSQFWKLFASLAGVILAAAALAVGIVAIIVR